VKPTINFKKMRKIILASILLFFTAHLSAQQISVEDLSKLIKETNVVVIDARPAGDYLKTHIDGAINIDVTSLSDNSIIEGSLRKTSELATILGNNGVAKNNKIIIYCKTGVSAGRMYWILKYLGCEDVALLDGNMNAWFAGRKAITKNPKKLTSVTFTPSVNQAIFVDKAYVKSKLASTNTILVDSRKKEEFEAGHIGNAINIPSDLSIADTKLKPVSELTANFSMITKDKEVILYCKTGTTASFTYFILKSILKYPNVKVYDGAYLDWIQK
jgi:thiosulfate/3-mercaptopyruvate sulfurtransferase